MASLAQFLRLPPVSTKAAFQKHILGPLSEGGANFAKPLQEYLQSYCLRRSEKCLTLPPALQENVRLQLSPEERELYNRVFKDTRKQIDSLISKGDGGNCSKLFSAMLKMRILCNLGTFPSSTASVDSPGQLQSERGCERCSPRDEDTFMLLDDCSFCPDCRRPLKQPSLLLDSSGSQESDASYSGHNAEPIANKYMTVMTAPTPWAGFSTKLDAVVKNVTRAGPGSKQ